jgi:hypothetical protein
MADDKKTPDKKWRRTALEWAGKGLADHLRGIFLAAGLGSGIVIAALSRVFTWVATHWFLLASLVTVLAMAAALIWQAIAIGRLRGSLAAARRPPRVKEFEPIKVEDPKANLHWRLRRSPEDWKRYDEASRLADVQGILDGPFCSVDKCAARLQDPNSSCFQPKCPTCGNQSVDTTLIPTGYGGHTSNLEIGEMRTQALSELQRMMRAEAKIEGPTIELERPPRYWKRLRLRRP